MNLKLLPVIALLAVTPVRAQNQDALAQFAFSKADVQKVIDDLKSDQSKFSQFCELGKLHAQYSTVAEKDEKKLDELDKAEAEAMKKLGPGFEMIVSSDLDEEAATLLDGLSNSCPK